jgi:ubiquinone/menaquinone biosynthesis C-methylase UbiE
MQDNLDKKVIEDFGSEWVRFSNNIVKNQTQKKIFDQYFSIFPKNKLNKLNVGFDMGCGSGRWAYFVAPLVKKIYCIEPSDAIYVAQEKLKKFKNCVYVKKQMINNGLKKNYFDFGYCLGVLHHIQNTQEGLNNCVKILKKNSPLLLYLYYDFENKNSIYKSVWKISNIFRITISSAPKIIKYLICDFIALTIYWPCAKFALIFDKLGINKKNIPLYFYKNLSFYHMRNDALDRFGTKVEKRYSRKKISLMMNIAGLNRIKFSKKEPFWCAIGYKK